MQRALGVVMILGGLACGFFGFLEAGGSHGFAEFRAARLFSGNALLLTIGLGALLLLGLVLTITAGGKKP